MQLRQLFAVVEMRTKLVSMSTLAGATIFALRDTGRIDWLTLALTLPAVLLVDMGTTAFNSFFDYWRGGDRDKRLRETDKVLATEGVPALAAFLVAAGCYFLAVCFGVALAVRGGAWVIAAGFISMAAGFLYNGGPLPISRTPVGELVAGGFLGTGLFLIAFRLQTGFWGARTLLASIPGMLFIASILAVNNACDIEGDRSAGRRTLAILVGPAIAARVPPVLCVLAFASTVLLAVRGVLPLMSAVTGPIAAAASLPLYLRMRKRGFSHATKGESMRGILGVFSLWSLGFFCGLLIH